MVVSIRRCDSASLRLPRPFSQRILRQSSPASHIFLGMSIFEFMPAFALFGAVLSGLKAPPVDVHAADVRVTQGSLRVHTIVHTQFTHTELCYSYCVFSAFCTGSYCVRDF
jgi:hypothetical protein